MDRDSEFVDKLPKLNKLKSYDDNGNIKEIDGHRNKQFYLLNAKDNLPIIKDLINDLKTKDNSNYITIYNNLIYKDKYIPKNLSIIVKESDDVVDSMCEVASSRILNYFDVPTVYNKVVSKENKFGENRCSVMSVDFVANDKEFVTLSDIGCFLEGYLEDDVPNIIKKLDNMRKYRILNRDKVTDDETFQKQKITLLRNYIKSFLVNFCVLKDMDLSADNFGIFIDNNFNLEFAPCFDNEKSIPFNNFVYESQILKNLNYCENTFPEIVDEIGDKCCGIIENNDMLDKLFDKDLDYDKYVKQSIIKSINDSARNVYNACIKTKNESKCRV